MSVNVNINLIMKKSIIATILTFCAVVVTTSAQTDTTGIYGERKEQKGIEKGRKEGRGKRPS